MASTSEGNYIGGIDQGTSSSRFLIFDRLGTVKAQASQEYKLEYPEPGWAQVDPYVILSSVSKCIESVGSISEFNIKNLKCIGITNQRETCLVWDKNTGEPLSPAIIWLDTRTTETVDNVLSQVNGNKDHFRERCGLPISTYFSALKWKWMLDNIEEVKTAVEEKNAMFGTIDTWLVYKLTGEYVTDVTNASRTMLMNLKTGLWDKETCDFFGIDDSALPKILSNSETYGVINSGALEGVAITSAIGDQQAATLGQLCTEPGMAKNTYGTGCFLLLNTGTGLIMSQNGLLSTALYKLGPEEPLHYALEGSIAIAGEGVKWLRDKLEFFDDAPEIEKLARSVEDSGGVIFVPAFSGLFAPYWNSDATGTLAGMTLHTTKAHICRAFLESVAFQSQDVLEAMVQDSGVNLARVQVDGGMTKNNLLMQIQANVSNVSVARPDFPEMTVLGAALAAGLAVNFWESLEDAKECIGKGIKFTTFEPSGTEKQQEMLNSWKRGIKCCEAFCEKEVAEN